MRGITSVVEVDGVSSIQVLTLGSTVRISRIDCPRVVGAVQHEAVGVLTETIEMWFFREMSLEVDILTFEDQLLAGGIEENFSSVGTRYGEREWVCLEIELQL